MGDFDDKAKENAKILESEIDKLKSGHWDWFQRTYKSFWDNAKQISQMFKTIKPLKSEDRERLWNSFSNACEEAKRKQQSEHEKRQFKSKEHRNDIIKEIERARPCSLFGLDPPDVETMKEPGRVLKSAGSMLSDRKQEMFGEHKQECFDRLQDVRSVHDAWWKELKSHRSRKQEDFQHRVRANLESNYERHRKATDALRRVRNHADDLRSQISSAWNDDFRDRAYGWLSETEDKIRDIEDSIQRIEDWIREDEAKL